MVFVKKSFIAPTYYCQAGRKCCCKWDNQEHYLGAWNGVGSPSPEILQKYLRLVVQLEHEFKARQLGIAPPPQDKELTINEAVLAWMSWLETEPPPDGDRMADGTMTSHFKKASWFLRPLVALYGDTMAGAFDVRTFRVLRNSMIAGNWKGPQLRNQSRGWSANTANEAAANVLLLFNWLESQGYIREGLHAHLTMLKRLTHTTKVERATVDDEDLAATLSCVSPIVADLIRIQRITAARPSELTIMRICDIDMSHPVWVYTPSDFKTKWRGKSRSIPLGTECQEILASYLNRDDRKPEDFLFSPRESAEWWRVHREESREPTERKTPIYPCELKRRAKEKKERAKRASKRHHAPHYTKHTLATAIERGITKARLQGYQIKDWTPYCVRHTRITEVQYERGWFDAQAVAGHETMNQTKEYSHQRHQRAIEIASAAQEDKTLPPPPRK